MKSPFPGMDPFLEAYWPDVHTSLMTYLRNVLQPLLPDGLFARIEESPAIDDEAEARPRNFRTDVLVAHVCPGEAAPAPAGGVVLLEPDIYQTLEEEVQRRVEIIDVRGGGHVVTIVEVLSPSNKGEGRAAYRHKQRLVRNAGIHLVEIDLLRAGEHALAVPRDEIPPHKRTPYNVCLSHAGERGRFRVWHIGLRQRLPAIPIPLRPGDPEPVADLQPLLDACYRDARYDRLIDYRQALQPPLSEEDAAIVETHLRESAR